ncbi:MAG: type II toxin-antitoxin system PemK/MazF family toxin [Chloroflexi bacterium]|nr:type II toxin-antitoxin system PemK/MazF family toxin [Chloroflexota bacterium]
MAIVCPIANTNRRHPFHVSVPQALSLTGFIMVEQVKSVDYHSREIQFVGKSAARSYDGCVRDFGCLYLSIK